MTYATPTEYMITPEIGDCTTDETQSTKENSNAQSFQKQTYERHAVGLAPITVSGTVGNAAGTASASASTTLSALVGNSQETQAASSRFAKGLTRSFTQTVTRTYYR